MSALSEAELSLAGALVRRARANTPEERARREREVKEAEKKLDALKNKPATPAATEPRCWCGAALLQVGRRQVCALGTHDD